MSRFSIHDTKIHNLKIVERRKIGDSRGFLSRIFCREELSAVGWIEAVEQINHTYTKIKGTIRGLHLQLPPYAEIKLVSCIRGSIWDVAVDLRVGSPTYLKWHAEELTADNQRAVLIPEGFAHGFQTLTNECELIYLHSKKHTPNSEAGINFRDPMLAIEWPLEFSEISPRDNQHPMINPDFIGIKV